MEAKSTTPIDDYTFPFSDEIKAKVENDFRETEEMRSHGIKAMREWVAKNPRIAKVRLDSKFLLRFLRAKRYSLPKAQDMLERYLILRLNSLGGVQFLKNLDFKLPAMQNVFDLGAIVVLPQRDALGRKIIIYRSCALDVAKYRHYDILKMGFILAETLLEDELNQINGFVHVIDSTSNVGLEYLTLFTPLEGYKIAKNIEKSFPIRNKEYHRLPVNPSLELIVSFVLSKLSHKIQNRFIVHKTADDFQNSIDKNVLPLEYGGTVPISEMLNSFKKELEEKRETLLSLDAMAINTELYPQAILEGSLHTLTATIDSIIDSKDIDNELYGLQGSFRKLEID